MSKYAYDIPEFGCIVSIGMCVWLQTHSGMWHMFPLYVVHTSTIQHSLTSLVAFQA